MSFLKLIFLSIILAIFSLGSAIAFASPPAPASATCRITCRVAETIEWSQTSFEEIDLGELNSNRKQTQGQSSLILYTNGDVEITADNSENAALSNGSYKLKTLYQLRCDNETGILAQWCPYDSFLKEAVQIKHNRTDGAVLVILSVKAETDQIQKGSGGEYAATQTLTVCWRS